MRDEIDEALDAHRRAAQARFNAKFGWLIDARDGLPVMVHWSHMGEARGPYRVRHCGGRIWLQVEGHALQPRTVLAHSLLSIRGADRIVALDDDGLEMKCTVRMMTEDERQREFEGQRRNMGLSR